MGFIRQPCTLKLLTTCCDTCGQGREVQWLPAKDPERPVVSVPSYHEAEKLLDEWEAKHVCESVPQLAEALPA